MALGSGMQNMGRAEHDRLMLSPDMYREQRTGGTCPGSTGTQCPAGQCMCHVSLLGATEAPMLVYHLAESSLPPEEVDTVNTPILRMRKQGKGVGGTYLSSYIGES